MTTKIIACEVMKEELLAIKPHEKVEYQFVSMGLHLYPKRLHQELQAILDESNNYSKIILAFGLCGGAATNLKAPSPLLIPRVHDCISIFLGSRKDFETYSREEKGTFYLTCGWLIAEKNIMTDYQRVCNKYGEKKARNIFSRMYDSYKQILFIRTGTFLEEEAVNQSRRIADLLQLQHRTMTGNMSYLRKIVNGPWPESEFIHVAPQAAISDEMFGICANCHGCDGVQTINDL